MVETLPPIVASPSIVAHPIYERGQLTAAWIRRETPPSLLAGFLRTPVASALREVAIEGGEHTGALLDVLAEHGASSLTSLRLSATCELDLDAFVEPLDRYTHLSLSGPVRMHAPLPGLQFLGWVDRRGGRVRLTPPELRIHELWTRTTAASLQLFLGAVSLPEITRMTVYSPGPLHRWAGLHQLEELIVAHDSLENRRWAAVLREHAPEVRITVGSQLPPAA